MAASKGVITVVERRKICMAHSGDSEMPRITHMAWGAGGVQEDGTPKQTTGEETGLYNLLLKKPIEAHSYTNDEKTTCRYTATLEAEELTGKEISEMGLYDDNGDLASYRTFLRKGKDEDIPQIYDMDEIF